MARNLPHPSSLLVEMDSEGRLTGRMSKEWLDALSDIARRVPVTGTATFAAATSVAVTLPAAEPSTAYNVEIDSPSTTLTFGVGSKTTSGFTISASGSNSVTVGWSLTRR